MHIDLDNLSNARIKKQLQVFILMSPCKHEKQFATEILENFKKTKNRDVLRQKLEVLTEYVATKTA